MSDQPLRQAVIEAGIRGDSSLLLLSSVDAINAGFVAAARTALEQVKAQGVQATINTHVEGAAEDVWIISARYFDAALAQLTPAGEDKTGIRCVSCGQNKERCDGC